MIFNKLRYTSDIDDKHEAHVHLLHDVIDIEIQA